MICVMRRGITWKRAPQKSADGDGGLRLCVRRGRRAVRDRRRRGTGLESSSSSPRRRRGRAASGLPRRRQVNPQRRALSGERPSAKSILVQRHLGGPARLPETRCFFVGGEFAYAWRTSTHARQEVRPDVVPRERVVADLPAKHWRPHVRSRSASGRGPAAVASVRRKAQPLRERYAWPVRVDVGTHARVDLDGLGRPSAEADLLRERGRDRADAYRQFGHRRDYVAAYGRALLTRLEAGRRRPRPTRLSVVVVAAAEAHRPSATLCVPPCTYQARTPRRLQFVTGGGRAPRGGSRAPR